MEHIRAFTNRPVYTKHQTFVLVHFVRTPNHKPRRANDRGATGQISTPATYTHAHVTQSACDSFQPLLAWRPSLLHTQTEDVDACGVSRSSQ